MKKTGVFLIVLLTFAWACHLSLAGSVSQANVHTSHAFVIQGEEQVGPLYDYVLLADQSVRIVKCRDAASIQAVPESIDGHAVSEIGGHSYSDNGLKPLHLFIPDCVTAIQQNAFGDVFTRLYLEVSDTHPTLKTENGMLVCPAEKRVIRGGFINDLVIPEGVETVDDHAFWGCTPTSVYIPSSVKQVGRNPFAFCCSNRDTYYSLKSTVLSPENTALEILDGVLFSRADRRLIWCFDPQSNRMPDEPYMIPEGTEIIDDFAFQRWDRIRMITVPASVKQIGINPFIGRATLEGIKLDKDSSALALQYQMLISAEDHRLVCAIWSPGLMAVPDGIETIGDYAFMPAYSRIACSVTLPDSVTVIGRQAFAGAESAEIHIPAGIRQIGDSAFADCTNITELPAFNGGLSVGKYAFYNCTGITQLTIHGGSGESASYIGFGAFASCKCLENVILTEGVTAIESQAFFMCGSLSEVQLPESLSYIGGNAFLNSQESEYNKDFDTYIIKYCSTIHAVVPSGSYAEQYCAAEGISFSAR